MNWSSWPAPAVPAAAEGPGARVEPRSNDADALPTTSAAAFSVVKADDEAAAPCNVMDSRYAGGAKGDNTTEDTASVASALATCAGGRVLLPAGNVFLLRPLELPSRTTLLLEGDIQAWLDYKVRR